MNNLIITLIISIGFIFLSGGIITPIFVYKKLIGKRNEKKSLFISVFLLLIGGIITIIGYSLKNNSDLHMTIIKIIFVLIMMITVVGINLLVIYLRNKMFR